MKKFILIILFALLFHDVFPGPGDTIQIQTFEFEGYPVGEGWLAPREGIFDFSSVEGIQFEKILAYYTLKCDNNQNPACGEWDYLSYLQLFEHTYTGQHPNFKLYGHKGRTPDSIRYMNTPAWSYHPRFETSISWSEPSNFSEYAIGSGTSQMPFPFASENNTQRSFFLWTENELTNSGLLAGIITGMQFNISSLGSQLNCLTIRLKNTDLSELTNPIDTTGFITVYSKNTQFLSTGWQALDFTSFFSWDGTSNILIDIAFSSNIAGTSSLITCETLPFNCMAYSSNDNSVFLSNTDQIHAPVENLSGINEQITISFWAKGDPDIQPNENSIFEGIDVEGNRIINVHLPWSDQNVYWDAGNDTGYDRIQKLTSFPAMYEGEWHHWTFTKNAVTKYMKIYFDGILWNTSAANKQRTLGSIDSLIIGKGTWSNDNNYYAGNVDEFQIWDIELSETEIQYWMHKEIDNTHPNYANLKLYYKFNESSGHNYYEEISGTYSESEGIPQNENFGLHAFKNFQIASDRPNIKFIRHLSTYNTSQSIAVDSLALGQDMLLLYEQQITDEKPVLTDILYVWPAYYNNYVYDENGTAIDSSFVTPDAQINKIIYTYATNNPDEEIFIPWELGRFITPYGNGLSLGNDGWTWIFDVTKFGHLFHGNDVVLKAGNFQELLDLKFIFIEGTPPRDIIKTEKLWSGNFNLSTFFQDVQPITIQLNPNGEMFELFTTVTGHGFGSGNNCGEFCPNTHTVLINGSIAYTQQIIQECGLNPLFPQGGTWFYDRAGWCPGMPATTYKFDITPFINESDTEVDIDYNAQYDPYGNYVTEAYFVTYGDYNFSNDVEIYEVVAPNNFKLNNRFNPICGNPMIKIKNNGSLPLTSLNILYGISDQNFYNYEWSGNLAFGEIEEIMLPAIPRDEFFQSASKTFSLTLELPNGLTDEYPFNNSQTTYFNVVPEYPNQMVIQFYSNKRYWENSYEIIDINGEVVHSKSDFQYQTLHYDTLSLENGCYEFVCYDTGGDGMYNWPSNYGTGYIRFYDIDGNYYGDLEEWFGQEIRHKFVLNIQEVSVEDQFLNDNDIVVFPNPANKFINIKFGNNFFGNTSIEAIDLIGNSVLTHKITDISEHDVQKINVSGLNKGVYFLVITNNNKSFMKKVIIN